MINSSAPPPPSRDGCLFLDFDGTLVGLTQSPLHIHVDAELETLLRTVSRKLDGAVALVSGRRIDYLDAVFTTLRLPCAGLHGMERRTANGEMHGTALNDSALDDARRRLNGLVRDLAGTLLEDKGGTLAVHYREAPQFAAAVRDCVTDIGRSLGSGYHVLSGSMMFEIKPRGIDKGTAVDAFLQEQPFCGRRPIYLGDDLTDLDGFRAVEQHGGVSISVGERIDGRYRLADPAAVRSWLARI